jgi:hypothetical protein
VTVEIFEMTADGLVKRNIVYWGSEEVSSRFRIPLEFRFSWIFGTGSTEPVPDF